MNKLTLSKTAIAANQLLQQKALAYLSVHNVMTLATHGASGSWAAAVFYVNDQFDLYFLSAGHTQHATHIAENPKIAAAIHEDYKDWPEIKGIQLRGEAILLDGALREAAIERYLEKYPFVANSAELQPALRRVNWYRLRCDQLYMIDNSVKLGHRDLIIDNC
ncbi:MAG: pyridoxamine 5'-phosphate oxidase family protein [Candidatus Promineifilaceae bacterium]